MVDFLDSAEGFASSAGEPKSRTKAENAIESAFGHGRCGRRLFSGFCLQPWVSLGSPRRAKPREKPGVTKPRPSRSEGHHTLIHWIFLLGGGGES